MSPDLGGAKAAKIEPAPATPKGKGSLNFGGAPQAASLRLRPRGQHTGASAGKPHEVVEKRDLDLASTEKLLWLLVASVGWAASVVSVLKWQRFPFHLHRIEVAAIVCIPIALFVCIFAAVDRIAKPIS